MPPAILRIVPPEDANEDPQSPGLDRRADPGSEAETRAGPAFDAIIAAAQAGADWALTILYRRFQPALTRYLHAHAPGQEDDLASDVWLSAARTLTGFSGDEDDFGRWIFTIARRRAIDAGRKGQRRRTDAAAPDTFASIASDVDPEGSVIDRLAGDAAVARIVALLPKARPTWCCCGWWPAWA